MGWLKEQEAETEALKKEQEDKEKYDELAQQLRELSLQTDERTSDKISEGEMLMRAE